jgi:hypothetical protein
MHHFGIVRERTIRFQHRPEKRSFDVRSSGRAVLDQLHQRLAVRRFFYGTRQAQSFECGEVDRMQIAGQQDDRQAVPCVPDLLQDLPAIRSRQIPVQQQDIERPIGRGLPALRLRYPHR